MHKLLTPFTKGELITISAGCFSDYYVEGVFRVLRDFDPTEVGTQYATQYVASRRLPGAEVNLYYIQHFYDVEEDTLDFYAWLIHEGYLEVVESREWHLGDDGELDLPFGEYS
jgi:hypothetical protein